MYNVNTPQSELQASSDARDLSFTIGLLLMIVAAVVSKLAMKYHMTALCAGIVIFMLTFAVVTTILSQNQKLEVTKPKFADICGCFAAGVCVGVAGCLLAYGFG